MAKDPAYLFYTNDFVSGTQFFSDEQVGKYIRLLSAQHQHGHLTEKQMLFICKSYDEQIFSKFKKDDAGLYYNARLDAEINRRKKFSESRSDNRKGAVNKKTKKKKKSVSYVPHMETETEIVNELELETENFPQYPPEMRKKFLNYWTEKDRKGKQRWKKQDTWETGKRLATWATNDENWNGKSGSQTGKTGRSVAAKDSTDNDLIAAVVSRHAAPGSP